MSPFFLLAWVVSWSCVVTLGSQVKTTINPSECNERVISECQCGENGRYQDVYVSSCQVHAADNATRCEPCPGSCGAYKLCKTCSKESCLSCPSGRWGRFCENAKNSEAKNLDYSGVSEDDVKSYIQETESKEEKFELFPAHNLPNKNISPGKVSKSWKYKGKSGKNKYDRDPITVKDAETTEVTIRNTEQPYSGIEKAHYVDVFQSKDNPEVSHLFSDKGNKFTTIQKSKEKLTVLQESPRENDRDEFRSLAKKQENKTDMGHGGLINRNGSFIYTTDSVNSPVSDVLNFSSGNANFSEIMDLKRDNFKDRGKENSDEKLNSSPSHSNNSSSMFLLRFQSSDGRNIDTLQEKKDFNSSSRNWKFPYESPKVHESADSEKVENFNSSSNYGKFSYESPKVHKSADSEKVENFNSSSNYGKLSYGSQQMYENDNSEAKENLNGSSSQWLFPREFHEVQESVNSEENIKFNSSSNYWKFPFESPEVQESPSVGKRESNAQILEPKSQAESGQFFEKEFDFKDIKDPSFSLSYGKNNFHTSEFEKESAKSTTEDKNPKLNAMRYRLAFAFRQIGTNESNKQSASSEMVSESPEMQIPSSSSNKMKIIDTEGNVSNIDTEFINVSREQADMDRFGNSSETSDDHNSKLSENNSKEFALVNPLEVNIFKITFIGEHSASPYNRHSYNITEKKPSENGGKLNITQTSQNETPKLPGNTATGFQKAIPHNASIFRLKVLEENINSSSDEKNKKITIQSSEDNRGGNTKEKRTYFKRNATNRPQDEPQYDLDMVQKMMMQLPELTMNKAKKPSDEKLYSSQSFSTSNIPENHILMPLYFPEMYNTEYQSNLLHNSQPHKLCDLYPNFSPCFRVRMILPGSPFIDLFGSKSKIQSKLHEHKVHSHHFPKVNYYDSENKMGMHSSAENGQNHLTDSQLLALLKKYLQSKNTENTSPLPSQDLQLLEDILLSLLSKDPQSRIQGWNKEERLKDGIVSLLLGGLVNPFLSFKFPKYGVAEPPTQSAILRQKEFHKSQPEQSAASNEIIEFSLDANEPIQSRSFPNTYGYRFSRPVSILKDDESHEKNCSEESPGSIQKDNSKAEMLPKTLDNIQIKIIRPIFGQTPFENDIDNRGELNFLESEEDPFFESCAKCVFTESVYEDVGAEKKQEKALPTIFRSLIVDEGLQVKNQSDLEKQNASRSRRSMYSYGTQSWCPIVRQMLNGDLDCTIWSYQKVCLLICHPGFKCVYNTFTCSRQNNTWEPNITPCVPIISYRGLGYRAANASYFEDVLNYLPDKKENFESVGSYYNRLVNNSYDIYGNMGANNQEESFPYYEPPPLQWENNNGNQNIRNMPFEMNGNSEFDQNQRLSNNASLDVRVNPEFPIESYPNVVTQDGRGNGNYGFGNIQSFPGDSTAGRTNNSKFDGIQGFPGYKVIDGNSNSTFDNIQRFPGDIAADRTGNSKFVNSQGYPGYEILNRNSNSTFGNPQGFPGGITDGRKENSPTYNNQGYPGYEILNRNSNSTFGNIQGFPVDRTDGRKENFSAYNNQGFPGYEVLDRKESSAYAVAQSLPSGMTGDRRDNSTLYDAQRVRAEVPQNETSKYIINETQDFPDFVLGGGKYIDKKIASLDEIHNAERIFDMYEKKRAMPNSSPYKKFEPVEMKPLVEESDEQSDTIYSFFEKENPEPGTDDTE